MTYRFARNAAIPNRFIKDHPFTKKFFGIDVMTKKNKDFRMKQDLGLSAEDFEGIQSLFRKHTVWKDGKIGGKVQKWNLDKWAIENEDLYNRIYHNLNLVLMQKWEEIPEAIKADIIHKRRITAINESSGFPCSRGISFKVTLKN